MSPVVNFKCSCRVQCRLSILRNGRVALSNLRVKGPYIPLPPAGHDHDPAPSPNDPYRPNLIPPTINTTSQQHISRQYPSARVFRSEIISD